MSARIPLTATLSFFLAALAIAQDEPQPEPGQIGISLTGRASGTGEGKLEHGNTTYDHVQISTFSLAISQVVRIDPANSLRFSLDQNDKNIDQNRDAGDAVVPLPKELKSLSGGIAYTHSFNPRWIVTGRVGAGSYVTDTSLLSDGWAVSAMAMAIYNHSQTLTYLFGTGYSSNLNDLRLIPIFGLNWRPSPKWSVAIGFPRNAVTYHLNKELDLGFTLSGNGGAYYVKNDPLPGTSPISLADTRLQYREIRIGFDASWKICPNFRISGTAGQVVYRKFKYVDRDFELKSKGFVPFLGASGTLSF